MNDVYSKLRDPKLAYCDPSGLSSIVNSIAKEYPTNVLNHVQMNIVRFTRQYVDFILSREVGPELTRKTYNQVKQFILAELERNSSDSNLKRFPFEALMSEHDALFAFIIKIWDTARDVLQCRNLTKSVVKKEWWLYIPSMYQMLKVVCANHKEIAEERKKSRKRVFQAVQQKSLKAPYTFKLQKNELLNTYMNDVYSKIRDPKLAYCDASGLSSIVNSIAKEYATNALNHVRMNIVRFTRQYVDFILSREVGSELTRKTYNQVKQFILAELERNSSDSNLKRFPFEALMVIKKKKLVKRPQSEHDALFASIIKIWDTARDVLQCRNLTKSVVKKEWWLYIPSMYQMLKVVCANYKEIAEERKKSRKRGRALRLYYLAPLCHYQQRHIPIDSSGLHEIMSLAKLHGKFDSLKRDDSEHDALFASIIKIWDTARDVLQCRNLTKSVVKKRMVVVYSVYVSDAKGCLRKLQGRRALRLYYLVPLCHYQQRHIPIDSSGLHEIMSLAKLHGKFDSMKRDDVYDNTDLYWRSVFELRKVETFSDGYKLEVADYQLILTKTKVPSRRFGYHITTDGVQVRISVLKPLSEAKVNEWGLDDEEVFHPLPMNSETRIVAIDPGRRNLYDAVAGDEDSR
ncbi:hypothetical protein MP638_004189, partial [Amoeboaphelidium occidentale]